MKKRTDYINLPEFAKSIGYNDQTLRNWIKKGIFEQKTKEKTGIEFVSFLIGQRTFVKIKDTDKISGETGISTDKKKKKEEKVCSPIEEDKSIYTTSKTVSPSSFVNTVSGQNADLSDVLKTLSELAESQKIIAKAVIELKTISIPKPPPEEISGAGGLALASLPMVLDFVDKFNQYMQNRQKLEDDRILQKAILLKELTENETPETPETPPETKPPEIPIEKKLEQAQQIFNMLYPLVDEGLKAIKRVKK